MPLKSIGIVGCGAIGQALLKAVGSGSLAVLIAGVTSRTEKSAREFLSNFENPPPYLPLRELIAASDLIIEAAGGSVVQSLAEEVFAAGKDLMVISAGALLDYPEIMQRSRQTGCRLYVPSGAIAGLDGIKSACVGEITHVTMTTRKPPNGLRGSALSCTEWDLAGWFNRRERGFFRQRARSVQRLSGQRERFSGREPGRYRARSDTNPHPCGPRTPA